MTLNKRDWTRLQWSVALFVVMLVAGAAIVSISTKALNDAQKTNKQAKTEKDAAYGKASRADQEADDLRQKIAVFQSLGSHGIIGQEHRLDWIEKIGKIKKARKLIEVSYELSPQQKLDAKVVAPSINGYDIMTSQMKLRMELLHENDLLNFLADLRAEVQGYIRVSGCDLTRSTPLAANHGPAAQLHAACDIDWITIRENR